MLIAQKAASSDPNSNFIVKEGILVYLARNIKIIFHMKKVKESKKVKEPFGEIIQH